MADLTWGEREDLRRAYAAAQDAAYYLGQVRKKRKGPVGIEAAHLRAQALRDQVARMFEPEVDDGS